AKIPTEDEKIYSAAKEISPQNSVDAALIGEKDDLLESQNPIFKELSEPKLPELPKENRARLLMQSPTRLNFYWSLKNNPIQTLKRIFSGQTQNYTFVVKLVNQTTNREEIMPIEAEGSSWFDVDAEATYRAEIGFYAPNRPFVRVMFSNTVATPRKNPSPLRDYSPLFIVSANQFAEVLDVSGFQQDAFEVALAGDDIKFTEDATENAFYQFIGKQENDFTQNNSSEIRFALLALASGIVLENLRGQISKNLFLKLQENVEKLSAEKALSALQENFGVFSDEMTEEFFTPTVFGTSLINFPRVSRKKFVPKFAPLSSSGSAFK
ncbi:MAG: DUF4912 domain-containing protein, partial [Acidobacteria bacterium]|nr:DUF4912 domain-containing protein [Acidobacteriota bacterium]